MSPVPPEVLTHVADWLADGDLLKTRRAHTPSPSRLVKHCLAPLVHGIVSPTPLDTHAERVFGLLDAAEVALAADLDAASDEVDDIRAQIRTELPTVPVGRLLSSDDVQNRVAALLRDLAAPEWARATDSNGAPVKAIRPAWVGRQEALAATLIELAWTRRCRVWADEAGAVDPQAFRHTWAAGVGQAIQAAGDFPGRVAVEAGLGELEVPHLVSDPPVPRDWRLATDRSFHNRVQLYWDGRHVPKDLNHADPGANPPEERFASSARPGAELVDESVTRTLRPMGLGLPAHRVLADVVASAIGQAAADPDPQGVTARLVDVWAELLQSPSPEDHAGALTGALIGHARWTLRRHGVRTGDLDDAMFGECVARRVWVRLHAWELVESRIPTAELSTAVTAGLDKARLAGGVRRSSSGSEGPDSRRTENTILVITTIWSTRPTDQPTDILAHYRAQYSALRVDPTFAATGGIHPPKWVEALFDSRGEDS